MTTSTRHHALQTYPVRVTEIPIIDAHLLIRLHGRNIPGTAHSQLALVNAAMHLLAVNHYTHTHVLVHREARVGYMRAKYTKTRVVRTR
jgi:hypothetical protein